MTDDGQTVTLTPSELEWLMESPIGRVRALVPDGKARNWYVEQPQNQADADSSPA